MPKFMFRYNGRLRSTDTLALTAAGALDNRPQPFSADDGHGIQGESRHPRWVPQTQAVIITSRVCSVQETSRRQMRPTGITASRSEADSTSFEGDLTDIRPQLSPASVRSPCSTALGVGRLAP